jgi:hypothetical protein
MRSREEASSPLEPPAAPLPAAVTEEAKDVRLEPTITRTTGNPAAADLSLEEAEGQAGVDPRARPVPAEAFALRRRAATAGQQMPATRGALLTVTAGSVKVSGRDTATWTVHGSSPPLVTKGAFSGHFIAPPPECLRKVA